MTALDADWCTWSIAADDTAGTLGIGPLPDRKQIGLYLMQGNTFSVLAYFKDEDKARQAVAWIDAMVNKANTVGSVLHKLLGGAA